jgi:hypothetical protein
MRQTKVSHLVVIFAVLGAIGWAITVILQGQSGRSLPVPGLAAAAMWIFGISFALWTYFAKPRLHRQPGQKPFPPLAAARIAVLAMAASRTGAVIGGVYLGVALASISNSSTPAGWSAMIAAFLAATGSVLVVVSALWLESMCVARNTEQ